ncbi:caffeoylshikimate esterase isoform X3 [Corylus avellana]|uniref:caffeoylshikimate esterase isoform X3 n=1 Tax=Corylus avellana TaxID=13451 RepID=UPI00286D0DB5|nr:caffeoylshikimate esterase isoform X3 [Corylus avellana]
MDLPLTLRFRSPELCLFPRKSISPNNFPGRQHQPIILRHKTNPETGLSAPKLHLTVTAKKRSPIEGVSEELNAIASQNLDMAPARRRVRLAFVEAQQQLDHCLFKMAPTGIITEEWYERNSKGLEIFCKSWMPQPGVRIKGALCFCHGYGDTCTFFFEGIAKQIAASGYAIYALDHPGFGLSEGLHGYIPSFDELADNVIENYTKIKGRPELRGLRRFLFGQSMGGAVALKVHLKEPHGWDGVILVAPMCKSVYNVICYNSQTRLKTAVELLKVTSEIEKQVERVSSPLLILHGAADKVTDPLVSQFLYEKASTNDKTLKLYEDGYHCILEGEPDDRIFEVLNDIIAWLDSRCSSL